MTAPVQIDAVEQSRKREIRHADLLVHEATFTEDEHERAVELRRRQRSSGRFREDPDQQREECRARVDPGHA